ncbi:Binding-protein-dependent transport systems inner membrane component [Methylocella tundrae]|uniref:Binding-protein-dependent transport systems inner membrane component n=1 Tax=Methylocella tundrae TaxID=227605 RepID=A0A8B6MCK0_METTU|nr:ABC transporter permease subunit [Methylocella tundrae]VTZ26863.1 Binding-protein-dependent transport systems inner membrane component [Methylocella tundrae]VTZ51858.1 Binding-protein-dependent transport systems inner membrane component [Methylocella tundrae]
MNEALPSLHSGAATAKSIPRSLALLALIAFCCVFGPLVSPHPFDRVYPDYVLAAPSLSAHPTAEEARLGIEDLAQRMGAHIASMQQNGGQLDVLLEAGRRLDPQTLDVFASSDLFGRPKVAESKDDGRKLRLVIPLRHNLFLFGTDANGRDLLTRTLIAGRVSLAVGLLASFVALVIGVAYGAIAGYAGGRIDAVMMRVVEIIYALPFIFFVIVLVMLFGRHFVLIFVAIGAVEWLDMARIARGQTLSLKRREYVVAAQALGASAPAIIWRHILPNAAGPITAYLTLLVPRVILLESFISFLGLGVQEPMASWGVLIADGARNIQGAIHLLIVPAAFLGATLGALQSLGQSLEERFAGNFGAGDAPE